MTSNPYSPTKALNAVRASDGSANTPRTDRDSNDFTLLFVAQLFAFVAASGLGLASAPAINAVSCPIGFELMGDIFTRARRALDAAELPLFIVMNVMYSLLQLPPTVLFGIFAIALLFVKGRFVLPVFFGSMAGYAISTSLDFGAVGSQWLLLTGLEMGLVALLFWYSRKRNGNRIHYRALNICGFALYISLLSCGAVYGLAVA